ncbi:cfz-2 [Pristionchus pacificus]|nr:cfz-2 [Pristionchus pacificus]
MQMILRSLLLLAVITVVRSVAQKCEPITIPLCMHIGYNFTSFPNSYGHEKQEEAGLEVHQFYPLVEYGCYKHLKFFLCTLYTPICQANYDKPILPCKEMCVQARDKCSPIMQQYGFRWPETLACEKLPSKDSQAVTGEICAAPPDTPSTKGPKKSVSVKTTRRPVIFDDPSDRQVGITTDCSCRCASPFVPSSLSSVGRVANCAYPCAAANIDEDDRAFMDTWMTVWAVACTVASTFTLLTFLIEPDRFQYPERPIFVLAFCQLMVAAGIGLRVYFGHEATACEQNALKNTSESSTSVCFAVFLLTYFFGMAASVWWVLLSLTWVLAAGWKWSSEAIANCSLRFHAVGWLLPSAQTVIVIIFNAIDGDPVTGLCYVGNTNVDHLRYFVLGPLVVYFIVGVFFLLIGFFNLWRIRSEMRSAHLGIEGAGRITRLISKIGVFSVLYTLPALFAILTHFYEQERRPLWEEAALCPCNRTAEAPIPSVQLWLSLLKTASMLLLGCSTGFWVMNPKTFHSWKARLCCANPARSSSTAKYQPAEMIYAKSDCSAPTPHYYSTAPRHYGGYNGDKL